MKLYFLDDGKDIVAPEDYALEYSQGGEWKPLPAQKRSPAKPEGHRPNVIEFPAVEVEKMRAVFTPGKGGRVGLTEFEAWGDGTLPYTPAPPPAGNLAFNPTGEGFPKATASFHDVFGGVPKNAIDGKTVYLPIPVNLWTPYGSPNATDWLEVDFGSPKEIGRVELSIFDDHGGVQPPLSYQVQYLDGADWKDVANQQTTPAKPAGSAVNIAKFTKVTTAKVRVIFTHNNKARSGVSEMEVWKE